MAPRTPLIRPYAYFASESDGRMAVSVWGGYVLTSTLFLLGSLWVLLSRSAGLIDVPVTEVGAVVRNAMVSIFVVAVVGLGVRILAMHWIARRETETGTIEDAILVSCWSYAPLILELGVVALSRWGQAQTAEFSVLYPADFAANLDAVFAEIGWAEQVVAVFAVAWSVYILTEGVVARYDIGRRRPVLVAALVGVVHLLV